MTMYMIWLTLAVLVLIGGVTVWLKDTWPVVRAVIAELRRRSDEPWTWMAFLEPIAVFPYTLLSAAFGLARPGSRWARWFYGPGKSGRAQTRYGETEPKLPQSRR